MLNLLFHHRNIIKASLVLGFVFVYAGGLFAQSTISGSVYDKRRAPLIEVQVELQNDYYQQIARTKTDANGRYAFGGLRDGRYTVKVYAFRIDYEDQSQQLEINTQNSRGGEGVGYFPLDFIMSPRKGGLQDTVTSVVFAQEVPEGAQKSYEDAVDDFKRDRGRDGFASLQSAINEFPDYYLALNLMGVELYKLGKHKESVPYLFKAMEVNEKNAFNLYYLGSALHKMGKEYNPAALTALTQAQIMAPSSIQILWVLGTVERAEGKFEDAEKHLLSAKKLSPEPVAEIHKELAQLYSEDLKNYKSAADELEMYLKASKVKGKDAEKINGIIKSLREKAKTQTGT